MMHLKLGIGIMDWIIHAKVSLDMIQQVNILLFVMLYTDLKVLFNLSSVWVEILAGLSV